MSLWPRWWAGLVLMIMGINATNSFNSDVKPAQPLGETTPANKKSKQIEVKVA